MSKFTLKETTTEIRGVKVSIRELTHKERTNYIKEGEGDKFRLPALLISLGATDPKMTEAEWAEEPAEVLDELSQKIATLSGLGKKEVKQKESDAGAAV